MDASCTNVRALALENPEIAEDSESEDRRDWSNGEGTTNRGPSIRFWFCFDGLFLALKLCSRILILCMNWYLYRFIQQQRDQQRNTRMQRLKKNIWI